MDNVGIIIIALLLCAVILGPLACASMTRGSRPKIYNPQEGDINDVCRRLKPVTTRSSVSHGQTREVDLEAANPQAELGECPVCIGPLIPEPAHTARNGDDAEDARSRLEEVTTATAGSRTKSSSECVMGLENTTSSPAPKETTAGEEEEAEDDILTLKSCGHSFHSKCLSSWFLIKRYDCPVCRVPYYKSHPRTAKVLSMTPLSRS